MKTLSVIATNLFLLLAAPIVSFAQDTLVMSGVPLVRAKASFQGSTDTVLSDSEKKEYRLVIMKTADGYLWSSRENRPLVMRESGIFTLFIESGGAGYIKLAKADDKYFYIEHMSLGLETYTYWGVADNFEK